MGVRGGGRGGSLGARAPEVCAMLRVVTGAGLGDPNELVLEEGGKLRIGSGSIAICEY